MDNLRRIPHRSDAVVIRSVFGGAAAPRAGYNSASLTQAIDILLDGFARGQFRQYWELTTSRR